MLIDINKCLSVLGGFSTEELHQHNQRLREKLAATEWNLAVALLASARKGLHDQLDYSSVTDYAKKSLNLSPQKTVELISTARVMEKLPLLSEAFRSGRLSWSKVRELKRVSTPETEKVWVEFALANTAEAIQRRVSCSPKEWKRQQALKASLEGEPAVTPEAVEGLLIENSADEVGVQSLADGELNSATDLESSKELGNAVTTADALPPAKLIRMEFLLTPDEYAVYTEAERRVRSRKNKKVSKSSVLAELARSEVDRGSSRERARYQILIHTNENGEAWYETERGSLPVGREVLEQALSQSKPWLDSAGRRVGATDEYGAAFGWGRKDIPVAVLRAVFARAGNRCECCGCRGGQLNSHHLVAVSDGGGNTVDGLRVLCQACHRLIHKLDFEVRADWARAREAALKRRGENRTVFETVHT